MSVVVILLYIPSRLPVHWISSLYVDHIALNNSFVILLALYNPLHLIFDHFYGITAQQQAIVIALTNHRIMSPSLIMLPVYLCVHRIL